MTDLYALPSVLVPSSSSRPSTPSRNPSSGSSSSSSLATGLPLPSYSSSASQAFAPNAFLVPGDFAPLQAAFNDGGMLQQEQQQQQQQQPAPFAGAGGGRMTRAASAASSSSTTKGGGGGGGGGGFVSFNPDQSDVEDDDEDDDDGRQVEGRPRKRKSTRDLRSAAASQSTGGEGKDEGEGGGGGGGGGKDGDEKARRKIQIEYIEEKSKRHITFSKRKAGIMKKAYELSTLTGTQVLLLVVSESGWVYTFTTDKFKPLVKEDENGQLSQGQKLIAACLEAKDGQPNLTAAAYGPGPTSAASTGNFEANSSIHGGQISLKTGPRAMRPTATNRRVSSKGRGHVPTPVHTGPPPPMDGNGLPHPPGSGGIPPVPQLPTPLTGSYLDQALGQQQQHGQHSPMRSPGGPRSLSHPPVSPVRAQYSMQQQQQQHLHPGQQHHQGGQQQQEYMDITQRTDMLHLQGYDQGYDLYSTVPSTSAGLYSHDPHSGLPQLPHPSQHHSQHHQSGHHSQPHTPHRLHHHSSSSHLQQEYDAYALPNPPPPPSSASEGGNYTHSRDPSLGGGGGGMGGMAGQDPRSAPGGGGWQTPQGHGQHGGGSLQGTPTHGHHGQQQQMYQQVGVVGGEEYGR
ncbi:hypothetical protein JCM8547_005035 [Rhodosporidiobolus lusitaniae]